MVKLRRTCQRCSYHCKHASWPDPRRQSRRWPLPCTLSWQRPADSFANAQLMPSFTDCVGVSRQSGCKTNITRGALSSKSSCPGTREGLQAVEISSVNLMLKSSAMSSSHMPSGCLLHSWACTSARDRWPLSDLSAVPSDSDCTCGSSP